MGILVPIVLFVVIGWVIKVLSDNSVKRQLITQGKLDENTKYLYWEKNERYVPTSLKWGMVLISLGLAIFIGKIISASGIPFAYHDEETMIFALMFIFGGLSLIIYYGIATKMMKKLEEEDKVNQ